MPVYWDKATDYCTEIETCSTVMATRTKPRQPLADQEQAHPGINLDRVTVTVERTHSRQAPQVRLALGAGDRAEIRCACSKAFTLGEVERGDITRRHDLRKI